MDSGWLVAVRISVRGRITEVDNGCGFVEVEEVEIINNHEVADVPKRKDW